MTGDEFEELLPAYLDGELNAEQTARVEDWLERSSEARRLLETYREINGLLASRRELVPPAGPFVRAVLDRPLLSRARDIMTALFSFPAISSLVLVVFAIALFIYREQITHWFSSRAEVPGAGSLELGWVRDALMQFSGTDLWTVTAVYVALTLAILLSTGLMVMRFLRD